MDTKNAINILKNACILAQSKGVFTLGDAKVIKEAIDLLYPSKTPEVPTPAEKEAKDDVAGEISG